MSSEYTAGAATVLTVATASSKLRKLLTSKNLTEIFCLILNIK